MKAEDKNIWGADSQGTNSIFMGKMTAKQADIDNQAKAAAQRRFDYSISWMREVVVIRKGSDDALSPAAVLPAPKRSRRCRST